MPSRISLHLMNVTSMGRAYLGSPPRNTFRIGDVLHGRVVKVATKSTRVELHHMRIVRVRNLCYLWCTSSVRSHRPHVQEVIVALDFGPIRPRCEPHCCLCVLHSSLISKDASHGGTLGSFIVSFFDTWPWSLCRRESHFVLSSFTTSSPALLAGFAPAFSLDSAVSSGKTEVHSC